MSDQSHPDTPDASCPLLDKLAPETRNLIYEYVLSFETPVKHATNMQPFLQKLTEEAADSLETPTKYLTDLYPILQRLTPAKNNSEAGKTEAENESDLESTEGEGNSDLESTEAEPKSSPSTEATGDPEPLSLVNTSILTTSKLVYQEAIAVFYKSNIISIDAQFCDYEALRSPQATDLSLATQVVIRLGLSKSCENANDGNFGPVESNLVRFAILVAPSIFPNVHSSKTFIYVDTRTLFDMAAMMRTLPVFSEAWFDGVGSVTACSSKSQDLKYVVQCRETMKSWAAPTDDVPPMVSHPLLVTARSLYQASRGGPQGQHAHYAQSLFRAICSVSVPEGYGAIDYDSYEFWTVLDQGLSTYQRMLLVQRS